MNLYIVFVYCVMLFCCVMIFRNAIVYRSRMKALDVIEQYDLYMIQNSRINVDFMIRNKFDNIGGTYDRMMFNFLKWKYNHFYGNLENDLMKYYGLNHRVKM